MCMSCVNSVGFYAGNAVALGALVGRPARQVLADFGLVSPPPTEGERDVRTVAFLRSLDLDPVAVLGPEVVADADTLVARPAPAPVPRYGDLKRTILGSLRPIGSHSRFATQ